MHTDRMQSEEEKTASPATPRKRPTRWFVFSAVIVGLLAGLFFILRPKVDLIVVPNTDVFTFTSVITVSAADKDAAMRTELLPIQASASVNTTGVLPVGLTRASGTVSLLNNTDEPLVLAVGTRFGTGAGVTFVTTERVTVPPRGIAYENGRPIGLHAGRAEVGVRAAEPGTDGNVQAGEVRAVPDHLTGLAVRNTEEFSGGTDTIISAVSAADVEAVTAAVYDALDMQLRDGGGQRASQRLHDIFTGAAWTEAPTITLSHQIGDSSHTLRASAAAVAQASWLDTKHFHPQVAASIPARLPIGYTWEQEAGFNVTVVGYDENEGIVRLHTEVPIIPLLDEYQLAQTAVGRSVVDAQTRLRQRFDVKHIQVHPADTSVLPDWAPWIRIRIRGDYTGLQYGDKDGR